MPKQNHIDQGKPYDWGQTSLDYAKYRDIYPLQMYQELLSQGLCQKGQSVLDIGTGTGVLPRNLYSYGAQFTGIDIASEQIEQARLLAKNADMNINFQCVAAEDAQFQDLSFDVITACQCFTYFDHSTLAPILHRILKPNGCFVILYMGWLPFEDPIAQSSEELMLSFQPQWTGCKDTRKMISVPDCYLSYFTIQHQKLFDIAIPFSRDRWHGRIKTCRAIEASLSSKEIMRFDQEHRALLDQIAPEQFDILHYVSYVILKKKEI